jgi:sugar phosphate isomerase/epimerase
MVELKAANRRQFLQVASATAAAIGSLPFARRKPAIAAPPLALPPLAVFSKFYQELKLNFDQSAQVTSEAGLDGIDCSVRKRGEIAPERAADDMPRYAAALAKRNLRMLLLTTGILSVDSPHAREILASAKKLDVRYYRLGFWSHRPAVSSKPLVLQIRAALKELAALNRQMGMCALFENHSSPANSTKPFAGGNLDELHEIVKDFDPNEIAIAFDLGHAIIMHGDQWRAKFDMLRDHVRVVYLKDLRRPATFVPFGEGEFSTSGFFTLLKQVNYRAPMSIHIEYPWSAGRQKTQSGMVDTLKRCRRMVAEWWQHAAAD